MTTFEVIMIASSHPQYVLCVHAPLKFLESKKNHFFLAICSEYIHNYLQSQILPNKLHLYHKYLKKKDIKNTVVILFYWKPLHGIVINT